MKTIAMTALAMTLAASAWAAERVPTATAIAETTAVHLSNSQMDSITAGNNFAIEPPRFAVTLPPSRGQFEIQDLLSILNSLPPTQQRSGFDLQVSLFGGSIFVAPPGCGGFFAEFGC